VKFREIQAKGGNLPPFVFDRRFHLTPVGQSLRGWAAHNNRSMEEEARQILRTALSTE
jgi:hypothetical protein